MRPRLPPPRPLVCLLVAVGLLSVGWALVSPPWQAPDETSHFGYAQLLAERFDLPGREPGQVFSTEQQLASNRSNAGQTAAVLAARPEWSEDAYRSWQEADARLGDEERGNGGGAENALSNSARTNPPLYYAWESLPYMAASGGDVFDRLYLMRIWSGLLLLVTVTATWLLIGEVFGRRPPLQLAGAALAGLQPMGTFISASVNPDALLIAGFAVAFWLGARVLLRGLDLPSGIGLCAATAVAVLTKASGYALVPAALLALGFGAWRLWRGERLRAALAAGAGALVLALPVGAWLLLARSLERPAVNQVPGAAKASGLNMAELGSYLWQFYLPKLPFQTPFPVIPKLPVYDVWVKTGWGAFGWLEVRFPDPVYVLLAVLTVAIVLAGSVALARRHLAGRWPVLAFLGLAALALLAGLHWTEYGVITRQGAGFNQGRYLLPLLPLLGLCAAGAIQLLGSRLERAACGALIGGLVVLQFLSLAVVAARFYA